MKKPSLRNLVIFLHEIDDTYMLANVHKYTFIEKNDYFIWRIGQIENHISNHRLGNNFPAPHAFGTCH
jgi:hypothetical protein